MKTKTDYKKVVMVMVSGCGCYVGGGVLYLLVELDSVQCLRDVAPLHTKGSHMSQNWTSCERLNDLPKSVSE